MGAIKDAFSDTFREFATDGVAASGKHEPRKVDIRAIGPAIEAAIANAGLGALVDVAYATRAELNADLAHAAGSVGLVYADATDANNDLYTKSGASGAGAWTLTTAFHDIVSGLTQGAQDAADQATALMAGARYNRVLTQTFALDSYNAAPVFSSGTPVKQRPLSSVFCGWATPFTWDGSEFDVAWYLPNLEAPGVNLRVEIWKGSNKTMLAYGEVYTPAKNAPVVVLLSDRVDAALAGAETVLYIACRVLDAGVRMLPHDMEGYVDVAAPATYPEYYTTTDAAPFGTWTQTGTPFTGHPAAFRLFDSRDLSTVVERPYAPEAQEPVLGPRLDGIVGREMNIYLDNLAYGTELPGKWRVRGFSGQHQGGREQPERWTTVPGATVTNGTLEIARLDAANPHGAPRFVKSTNVNIVAAGAAAGASRKVLCIGDSITEAHLYTQRLLDLSAGAPTNVQTTLLGTRGAAPNLHEGRSGFTSTNYYNADTGTSEASNPFSGAGGYFSASAYLAVIGDTPDIVFWHLGVNDAALGPNGAGGGDSGDPYLAASNFIVNMDAMIGLTADANIVSWKTAAPAVKHIVAIPTPPAETQDPFGQFYGIDGIANRPAYKRFLAAVQYRVALHYAGREADGIFVLGWNAVVDPRFGFPINAARPANADTVLTVVTQGNTVHPGGVGYNQMGDALDAQINVLVAKGLA